VLFFLQFIGYNKNLELLYCRHSLCCMVVFSADE